MMDRLFDGCRTPDPPSELRKRVLDAAMQGMALPARLSFVDRCWANRTLHWSWLAAIFVVSLFLVFWNPELPEISTPHKTNVASTQENLGEEDPSLNALLIKPARRSSVWSANHLISGEEYR